MSLVTLVWISTNLFMQGRMICLLTCSWYYLEAIRTIKNNHANRPGISSSDVLILHTKPIMYRVRGVAVTSGGELRML
jgi:hypothetical protein